MPFLFCFLIEIRVKLYEFSEIKEIYIKFEIIS